MANKNLNIENAEIRFRNFSGKKGQYNPEGSRNFCVLLDDEIGKQLKADGWNVRYLKPIDPEDDPRPYMQVAVRFDNYPPKIILVSSHGKSIIDENKVSMLDWAEFESIDLVINPSHYNVNGKEGIKAYLKTMYATIVEDPFEAKYYDSPDSAESTIGGCGNCEACDGSCKNGC